MATATTNQKSLTGTTPSHKHDDGEPLYPANWPKKKMPAHLRPQKFNSTSSLYIDSTISKPKNVELMHCMAVYLSRCIKDYTDASPSDHQQREVYAIFDESLHPITTKNANTKDVPSVETVEKYIKAIFKVGQLAAESLIMAVAYLERIERVNNYHLFPYNWRRIVLAALILASKVWEDQAVWNIDFIELFPLTTPSDLGQMEKKILSLLSFDVSLKASEYAKFYFDVRSLAANHCAEEHFLELKPLNKDGEAKLELQTQNFTLTHAKKIYRSAGSVDDIVQNHKSPRTVLN